MKFEKSDICIVMYVVMMFLTNAYCQVHRWKDWSNSDDRNIPVVMTGFATVAWPVYWMSRGSIYVVKKWPAVELKFAEKNES